MEACVPSTSENLKNTTQSSPQERAKHFLMAREVQIDLNEETRKEEVVTGNYGTRALKRLGRHHCPDHPMLGERCGFIMAISALIICLVMPNRMASGEMTEWPLLQR